MADTNVSALRSERDHEQRLADRAEFALMMREDLSPVRQSQLRSLIADARHRVVMYDQQIAYLTAPAVA